jgi:hypothetical protein
MRSSNGNILNISDHGALVFSDAFPQLGENVLIRLKRPIRSDWTGSIVVRHDQQNQVAIDFILGCPYDLVLAATLGIDIISSVLGLAGSDRFSNSGDYVRRPSRSEAALTVVKMHALIAAASKLPRTDHRASRASSSFLSTRISFPSNSKLADLDLTSPEPIQTESPDDQDS